MVFKIAVRDLLKYPHSRILTTFVKKEGQSLLIGLTGVETESVIMSRHHIKIPTSKKQWVIDFVTSHSFTAAKGKHGKSTDVCVKLQSPTAFHSTLDP